MVYLLGALMGFLAGNTVIAEKQVRTSTCHPRLQTTLAWYYPFNKFIGLLAIAVALYFVSTDYGNGVLEGSYFALAALDGALLSWILQLSLLSPTLGAVTFLLEGLLAFAVFFVTTQ